MKNLPNGWKKVELSEILESIENGNRPKGGITDLKDGIPSIGGEHINSTGGFNLKNVRLIPEDFYNSMRRGKIQKEDVLIVKDGATTGKISFVGSDFPYEDAAVNEHVFILKGKKDLVYQKFLFYHLYSPIGQRQMDANFHGAAIGGINTQFVKNYNLVLPPLVTQKKIAAVLEKAEKLREWRKEADGMTDKFLKSTFLEMFGDPASNPKGWEVKTLEDVTNKIQIGPFGTQLHEEDYIEGGIPLINPTHISNKKIVENINQTISKKKYLQLPNYHLKTGDVIMGRRGEMGRCALITQRENDWMCGTGSLFIRPKENLNSFYLLFLMSGASMKEKLKNDAQGVTLPNLNLTIIHKLEIPLPPLPLQQKFASIVQQVEQIRQHQEQSKQQIDHFFNVLMQKAFNGELEA